VKLVCSIDNEVAVSPEPLEASQPICVDGSLNSIQLKTKYIGDVAMIDPGTGGYQTATAVLSDLLAVEERIRHRKGLAFLKEATRHTISNRSTVVRRQFSVYLAWESQGLSSHRSSSRHKSLSMR
jgi:hypothetical protein